MIDLSQSTLQHFNQHSQVHSRNGFNFLDVFKSLFRLCVYPWASNVIVDSVDFVLDSSPDFSEPIDHANYDSAIPLLCGSSTDVEPIPYYDHEQFLATVQAVCRYCGDKDHPRKLCPANHSICCFCSRRGHLELVCGKRLAQTVYHCQKT